MSCFYLADINYDYMLTWAARHQYKVYPQSSRKLPGVNEEGILKFSLDNLDALNFIGNELKECNFRRVNEYYGENKECSKYVFKEYPGETLDVWAYQLARCYKYQTEEECNRIVDAFLDTIEHYAVLNVLEANGLKDAPWGLMDGEECFRPLILGVIK